MRKVIDFLGGCCVTLFFLVTYKIMWGINFYKDHKEARIRARVRKTFRSPAGTPGKTPYSIPPKFPSGPPPQPALAKSDGEVRGRNVTFSN